MSIIEHDRAIVSPLFDEAIAGAEELADAPNHIWLAHALIRHQLLAYLEYATPAMLVESMHALFYAFQHSGSREGLAQLCLGLFGHDALVILDDTPNTVSLDITVTNEAFYASLVNPSYSMTNQQYTLVSISLATLSSNPLQFLQQFLPAGVVLQRLDIGIASRPNLKKSYIAQGVMK